MSKYKDWMIQQDPQFIKEICGDNEVKEKFKDYKFRNITLEELEELDNKYINHELEAH